MKILFIGETGNTSTPVSKSALEKRVDMIKEILLCLSITFLVNDAFSQNSVAENGQLQIIGHELCYEQAKPCQLVGMDMFGLMQMSEFAAYNSLKLPSICVTPDGMAIAPDGSLLLTCPNYADQTKKACILKIDKNFKVSLFYEFPAYKPTGVVCPMGIDVDKNGDIYICDNQGWKGTPEGQFQGRILKLKVVDNNITEIIEVATGLEHPNGVKVSGNYIYVTQSMLTKVQDSSQLLTSAVYRFRTTDVHIKVTNQLNDKNLLVSFKTYNKFCQYGLDGLVFNSKGNLIVGNFGDGTLHKIVFDKEQTVSKVEFLAKTDFSYSLNPDTKGFIIEAVKSKMRTTDGLCIDPEDNIYVADFSNNAIDKVSPSGEIKVIAQFEDNDGSTGKLNQPGEPVLWNGKLVVSNFDMVTGPDKVNSRHDPVAFLTLFTLDNRKK